jgi:POT family proton-dependent oligopeptide transporter
MQSLFNWFYWAINLGALSSLITTNVEKYHSFWLAYLIPLIVFTGSIIVLLVGRQRYIRNPPSGSLIIRAFHVIKTAIQMRWKLGKQDDKKHILDYAKEIESSNEKEEKKQNINQFIDDLKQAIRACRVFAFYPFYWVCYNQLVGNLTSQAAQMNVGKSID